jgi:hypothetical protein
MLNYQECDPEMDEGDPPGDTDHPDHPAVSGWPKTITRAFCSLGNHTRVVLLFDLSPFTIFLGNLTVMVGPIILFKEQHITPVESVLNP